LPSMREALGSIPAPKKKRQKKNLSPKMSILKMVLSPELKGTPTPCSSYLMKRSTTLTSIPPFFPAVATPADRRSWVGGTGGSGRSQEHHLTALTDSCSDSVGQSWGGAVHLCSAWGCLGLSGQAAGSQVALLTCGYVLAVG
jgi:hypothetical protein